MPAFSSWLSGIVPAHQRRHHGHAGQFGELDEHADGTLHYWPRLTVRNGSALKVTIAIDGEG